MCAPSVGLNKSVGCKQTDRIPASLISQILPVRYLCVCVSLRFPGDSRPEWCGEPAYVPKEGEITLPIAADQVRASGVSLAEDPGEMAILTARGAVSTELSLTRLICLQDQ